MDVNIRFWNNETIIVGTPYFHSQFLERPNADDLFQSIKDSTSGLNETNFLQLAMDDPNVNWLVLNKLDDMLIENGHEKTVNIGSCAQHTVHGAFQTGTSNGGWSTDKILKVMFFILHDSPVKREVYTREEETVSYPLR